MNIVCDRCKYKTDYNPDEPWCNKAGKQTKDVSTDECCVMKEVKRNAKLNDTCPGMYIN